MFTLINRPLWFGVIGTATIFVLAGCASRPVYTSTTLEKLDTEVAFGIVAEQGKGRFSMKDSRTGEIQKFQTGGDTQFIPEGYRSQTGDEIRVVYTKVMRRGYENQGTPYMLKVYQIYSITVAPENELPKMPMRGKVTLIGRGSPSLHSSASFVLQLDKGGRTYKIHWLSTLDKTVPGGANGLLGHSVEVWARRIPNVRFNCYHYVAEKVTIVSDEYITQNTN